MSEARHPSEDAAGEVVGAVIPGSGPFIARALSLVRKEWQRNASQSLRAAETISGRSREDLEELLETNPELTPLYLRVLWAAGMNGHDETLRAMGATLGEAVNASGTEAADAIADADQALMAMSRLTPRHFRILRFMCSRPRPTAGGTPSGWSTARITEALGLDEDRVTWCLSDLVGTGLVAWSGDFFGSTLYWATALGRAVQHASDTLAAE
ncbi:hypothetical protein [Promicromonospora sp. NPDC050249]|uniref:hypothetical protein n=1 Tax=Promicromonospora sp. NPDC050249 TaxID=3154743 RepID=UPI0033F3F07A